MPVFPQCSHRIRCRSAGADGRDHGGRSSQHQLLQHERRQVVEQTCVVDNHQHRGVIRRRRDLGDHTAHQLQRIALEPVGPLRARTQRDRLSRNGTRYPTHRPAALRGERHRFTSQPSLAHSGTTGDYHARVWSVSAEHIRDDLKFLGATGQGPGLHAQNAKAFLLYARQLSFLMAGGR